MCFGLCAFLVVSHVVGPMITLRGECYYEPHVTDEETEAQRD